MKYGVFVFGVMAGLLTCTSVAETAGNARWIGVWQGQLDGQPGVYLPWPMTAASWEGPLS